MCIVIITSAWITGSTVTLERTLRDSGREIGYQRGFFAIDESLQGTEKVMRGMKVNENSVATNFKKFVPPLALGILIGRLTNAGTDRKLAHEILLRHAEQGKEAVRSGYPNPIQSLVLEDERITNILGLEETSQSFEDIYKHTGRASESCTDFLENELYPVIGK